MRWLSPLQGPEAGGCPLHVQVRKLRRTAVRGPAKDPVTTKMGGRSRPALLAPRPRAMADAPELPLQPRAGSSCPGAS